MKKTKFFLGMWDWIFVGALHVLALVGGALVASTKKK